MMKTNFLNKTVKQWKLWTIIASAIIVVGIVIAAIFGFNTTADMKSAKVVSVDYFSVYVESSDKITDACESAFSEKGVTPIKKVVASDMTDSEVIYYFDVNTDLTAAVAAVKEAVADATNSDLVKVNVFTEEVAKGSGVAEGYVWRAAVAAAVFAVLAFVYVSLRYKLSMGITMVAAMVAAGGLTVALVGGMRIPVTPSFAYAALFAVLLTTVLVLLTFNRLRDAAKDKDKQKDMTAEEKVLAAVDTQKIAVFVIALTVAVALLAIFVSTARWFALTAFIGIVAATFAAWIFAPALFVVLDGAIKGGDKPLFKSKKKEVEKVALAQASETDEVAQEAEETQAE